MKQYNYISLRDVLTQMIRQAEKDVLWMKGQIPSYINSPAQLFYWLESITSYQDDPENIELIQSPRSLFEKNWYGVPGRGDCDCFTVLTICCLLAMGYKRSDIYIKLVGRTRSLPKHVYVEFQGTPFDLTNPVYGYERNYPYCDLISI